MPYLTSLCRQTWSRTPTGSQSSRPALWFVTQRCHWCGSGKCLWRVRVMSRGAGARSSRCSGLQRWSSLFTCNTCKDARATCSIGFCRAGNVSTRARPFSNDGARCSRCGSKADAETEPGMQKGCSCRCFGDRVDFWHLSTDGRNECLCLFARVGVSSRRIVQSFIIRQRITQL